MLILDGHGSHLTPEFDHFCTENSIIPLCLPAHSLHLLQPLDVGCFLVLKRSYGGLVEESMRLGINHIDKTDFLTAYQKARMEAFKSENIRKGFAATGLVPYEPDQVLSRLHVQMKTPTPPGTSQGNPQTPWVSETPHNIEELQLQSETIKALLKCRTHSPPSPTDRALNQLIKGCQMAMHSAVILARENQELRAANEKQKQKRIRSTAQVSQGGILTIQEGQRRTETIQKDAPEVVEASSSQPKTRAPSRCSVCKSYEHTAVPTEFLIRLIIYIRCFIKNCGCY
ncbi:hypothetical protein VTN96DRAFT_2069 [Rasamsonia emersonii]